MLGSLAASAMSSTAIASGGGIAAGSVIAILQSAATGGAGAAVVNAVAGGAGAAATAVGKLSFFMVIGRIRPRTPGQFRCGPPLPCAVCSVHAWCCV